MRKKIFLYVGHSNFGKSETLKCLTDNISRKKRAEFFGERFIVRKMSNNDNVLSYISFVTSLEITVKDSYIISAFSPDREKESIYFLKKMSDFAHVHIFVQQYGFNGGEITKEELQDLRSYDENLEVMTEILAAPVRAQRFLSFIEKHIN